MKLIDFLEKKVASTSSCNEGGGSMKLLTNDRRHLHSHHHKSSHLTQARILLQIYIWGSVHNMGYPCTPLDSRVRQMLPYCSHRSSWCLPYFICRTSTARWPSCTVYLSLPDAYPVVAAETCTYRSRARSRQLIDSFTASNLCHGIAHTIRPIILVFSHCCQHWLQLWKWCNLRCNDTEWCVERRESGPEFSGRMLWK